MVNNFVIIIYNVSLKLTIIIVFCMLPNFLTLLIITYILVLYTYVTPYILINNIQRISFIIYSSNFYPSISLDQPVCTSSPWFYVRVECSFRFYF